MQSLGYVSGVLLHSGGTRNAPGSPLHTPEIEDQISRADANQCGLEGNRSAGTRSKVIRAVVTGCVTS